MNFFKIFKKSTNINNPTQLKIIKYLQNGRLPWSEGYHEYKEQEIDNSINNVNIINKFRNKESLPKNYGMYLDERIIEYPWLLSQINSNKKTILDAGSILNFPNIIRLPIFSNFKIDIVTLHPESFTEKNSRISYLYEDIRYLPQKNDYYDEIYCISTLEHIGMDNSIYTNDQNFIEKKSSDYLLAIDELKRVLKPNGNLIITVPYGLNKNFGYFQQFNSNMISELINRFSPMYKDEVYFKYSDNQWNFSDKISCDNEVAFNIHETKYFNSKSNRDYDSDLAACSRSILCLKLTK
jgi:SAM-dependent methyltransferase